MNFALAGADAIFSICKIFVSSIVINYFVFIFQMYE